MIQSKRTLYCSCGVLLLAMGAVHSAKAGGFQAFNSARGNGRAMAGVGVDMYDAMGVVVNPASAALSDHRQVSHALLIVEPRVSVRNQGSTRQFASPLGVTLVPASGVDGINEHTGYVPGLAFTSPLKSGKYSYSISLSSSFGLGSRYQDGWVGQYHALESELATKDLSLGIARKIGQNWRAGGSVIVQSAEAVLTRAVFLGPGVPAVGHVEVSGDSTGVGATAGVIYERQRQTDPGRELSTRIGVGVRSPISHTLEGNRVVSNTGIADGSVGTTAELDLPANVWLSAWHDVTPHLAVAGSVIWTDWSTWKELRLRFADGSPDDVTPQYWKDTVSYSVGVEYRYSDRVRLMAGLGFDKTPIPNETLRTPRNPDTDKTWLAVGGSLDFEFKGKPFALDAGMRWIDPDVGRIDNTVQLVPTAPGAVTDRLVAQTDTDRVFVASLNLRGRF